MMRRGAIFLIILAFWGCSSDPVVVPDKGTTTTLVLRATQVKGTLDEAQDSLLTEGVTLGIFVKEYHATFPDAFCKNRAFTVSADGSLATTDTVYLTENYSYDIYGYAPHTTQLSGSNSVEFPHGTDVLWCPKVTLNNVAQNNRTACLRFEHRMAQISFNVGFNDDYNGTRLFTEESEIDITGFSSKGELNIETGNIIPKGGFDASINAKAHNDGKGNIVLTVQKACFIPASESMQLVVSVHHSKQVFKAAIEQVFRPGTSYVYNVKIAQVALLNIKGKVVDWRSVSDSIIVE